MRTMGLLLGCTLLLTAAAWLYPAPWVDPVPAQPLPLPLPDININTPPVAHNRHQRDSAAKTDTATTVEAKASETSELPAPADFVHFDGEELVLTLSGMTKLNDTGRIDRFAKALRAEQRSDASLDAERQLTELLQTKIQTFRQSALSRIDCGEYFCLVVAPVQQQDQLFNEFLQHSKPLSFGSGSFYNFQSNGELYNSLILSLKANTSVQ